jgi:hypothetical protein
VVQFIELVPYLFLEDGFRGDHEAVVADEVGFALIAEVGVAFQELSEFIPFGHELVVLVCEHTDCSSRVDDQHLMLRGRTFLLSLSTAAEF